MAAWLLVVALLVFAMVALGGWTRLSHSGLSMVDWRPVTGVLPPLSAAGWEEAFAAYRSSPEFLLVNSDMDLDGYRSIFWLEYLHRALGRILGLAFVIPLVVFTVRGAIAPRRLPVFLGLLALGGLQGLVGWWMVRSGLVDRPEVSHFRLAVHLGLAALLFCALMWTALGIARPGRGPALPLAHSALVALALCSLTLLLGALVAGLDAGLVYNTFPLMAGGILPPGFPGPAGPLSSPGAVQFLHRSAGLLTLAWIGLCWLRSRSAGLSRRPRRLFAATGLVALVQVALGIATLLGQVPTGLALLHQACALLLLALLVMLVHALWRPPADVF